MIYITGVLIRQELEFILWGETFLLRQDPSSKSVDKLALR